MKKTIFLTTAIAIILSVFSCNNASEQKSDEQNNETKEKTELTDENKTEKSVKHEKEETKKTNAEAEAQNSVKSFTGKFDKLVPATDGTWFLFSDNEGNDYKFFDNGDCQKARDLFFSVQPMDNDHQYQSTDFYVEYQTKEVEFYDKADGGTIMREVEIITSIEEK
jgi:uncharacterized membrane-anchored protein